MIPFMDMKAQYASIKSEVDAAVLRVLESCQYVLGPDVTTFENQFAQYCNVKHAVSVNSGTSALHLALLAAGVKPGDEVITVSLTFVATAAAILYAGATPVYVDVNPFTKTLEPTQLQKAITPRTKAIIPVHLHGLMADMDPIMEIANAHGIPVIEDACQAHGASYKNQKAGSMGLLSAFSFYPGKNLGAYGEGGAIVTNDNSLAQQIRMLRDWGQAQKYHHELAGFNYRMDTIQAAVLNVKMKYIEEWTEKRRQAARWYTECLQESPYIILPKAPPECRHVYHIYAIEVAERSEVQKQLAQAGIMTGIHYPIPVHQQVAYATSQSLPVTEKIASRALSLPLFPEITESQVDEVCQKLQAILQTVAA